MTQVNLLPPELRERQRVRRFTSMVILSGVGLLAVVGLFFFLQIMNLGRAEDELRTQQQANAELQRDIDDLEPFAQLQTVLQSKKDLVDVVLRNEVSWSSALRDVSRLVPSDAYLTDLTGGVAVATAAEPSGDETSLVGSMSFNGFSKDLESLTMWLTHLEQVKGWVNPWVASFQAGESEGGVSAFQFSGSVDLSKDAVTRRGSRGESK